MLGKNNQKKFLTYYLFFMLFACSGAFVWQFFVRDLAKDFSVWGVSTGWQREISLWNVGIIAAILVALIKQNFEYMKILSLQCTVLCWLLGINHLLTLIFHFDKNYIIHFLGVFEVLLLGGIWGSIVLIKVKK